MTVAAVQTGVDTFVQQLNTKIHFAKIGGEMCSFKVPSLSFGGEDVKLDGTVFRGLFFSTWSLYAVGDGNMTIGFDYEDADTTEWHLYKDTATGLRYVNVRAAVVEGTFTPWERETHKMRLYVTKETSIDGYKTLRIHSAQDMGLWKDGDKVGF